MGLFWHGVVLARGCLGWGCFGMGQESWGYGAGAVSSICLTVIISSVVCKRKLYFGPKSQSRLHQNVHHFQFHVRLYYLLPPYTTSPWLLLLHKSLLTRLGTSRKPACKKLASQAFFLACMACQVFWAWKSLACQIKAWLGLRAKKACVCSAWLGLHEGLAC